MVYTIPSKKLIISHIPKSGCQSVRKFTLDCNGDVERGVYGVWENFKWYSHDISKLLNQGYELISIVRNPYARLVSGYTNKVLSLLYKHEPSVKIIQHFKGGENRISFEEFVSYITKQNPTTLDDHWKPQYIHIGENFLQSTKIFKLEENEIKEYLKNKTDVVYGQYKSVDLKKPTYSDTYFGDKNFGDLKGLLEEGVMPKWEQFYNDDLKKKVYNYYSKDFKVFGYDG